MTYPIRILLVMVWAFTLLGTGCGSSDDPPPPSSCANGEQCGGTCIDTKTNPQNCGGCGITCSNAQECKAGSCVPKCPTGQESCGGACVDTQSSSQHCGACGNACASGQICQAGSCALQCASGQESCGGACVDTQSNPQNCGACGNACASDQACRGGTCATPCPQGQIDCNGACVDTRSDAQNCGTCGNACNPGRVCASGQCGGCQSGLTSCGQACIDTQNDPQNCGGCGSVCGSGQSCIQGSCRVATSCTESLISPKADAWGASWDGLERVATTYAAAKQSCTSLGARLPTASELFRVNAKQQGTIGVSSTNYLWSLAPYNAATQHTVRLSDGTTSSAANNTTTKLTYRCVCAPATHAFTGNACFGQSGQGCFALKTGGTRYNMDKVDRPALSKNGALWECTFQHAHLADFATYAAAIVGGLPGGSGSWCHTGEDSRATRDTLVKWTGAQTAWAASGNTTASTLSTSRPFRCAGVNFAAGTHPNTVPNEFTGTLSGYKGETSQPVQASWAQAHDLCWSRGGHLPYSTELGTLIQEGLPNGDNNWLWTADQAGDNGTQFVAMVAKWSGTSPGFGYSYSDTVTHTYKGYSTLERPFRCIYYPLDPQYTGPSTESCQGGCTRFQLPGATPAILWMDNQDRPDATLESAAASCANLGGRLASERDFTEAIRHSLPNGSGRYLLTSDIAYDDRSTTTTPISRVMVLKWTAVDTGYTDQSPTYVSWSALPTSTSARPYRCMWTNELR